MPQCYVSSCSNYYGKTRGNTKIIYHMLPTAPEMVSKWIKVCRIEAEPPPSHARVCSEHFSENCYQRDLQHELLGLPLRKKLKYDAIPDLNLPPKISKWKKQVLKTVDCQNQVQKEGKSQNGNISATKKEAEKKIPTKKLHQRNSLDLKIGQKREKKLPRSKSHENITIKPYQQINPVDNDSNQLIKTVDEIMEKKGREKGILKKLRQQLSSLDGINIEAIENKATIRSNEKNNEFQKQQIKNKAQKNKVAKVKSNEKVSPLRKERFNPHCSKDLAGKKQILNEPAKNDNVMKREHSQSVLKNPKTIAIKSKPDERNLSKKKQNNNSNTFSQSVVKSTIEGPVIVITETKTDEVVTKKKQHPGLNNIDRIDVEITGKVIAKADHISSISETGIKVEAKKHLNQQFIKPNRIGTNVEKVNKKRIGQMPKLKVIPERSNDKLKRRPMRSSIRIAKKKSIESLSDSFTEKVNNKKDCNKRERFTDKLKFMAKLQLKHEKNKHAIIDLDKFFGEMMNGRSNDFSVISLNKMQIMENVVEGCNVQPSSPGHAEERDQDVQIKTEIEENEKKPASDNEIEIKGEEENADKSKLENISNGVKEEPDSSEIHEDNYSNNSSTTTENNKRKSEGDEYPVKRLRAEIQENFQSRDKVINDFIEMADCNNLDQINSFSDQLLAEIKTLNEIAKEKEREWNNIIHLKKLKEELLIRMQRKKQVLIINEKSDYVELLNESPNGNVEERLRNNLPQSILKSNLMNANKTYMCTSGANGNIFRQKHIVPKTQNNFDLNGALDKQGKRLTLDVQSIIADYRQRHPETVPRRGRRIRCSQSEGNKFATSIMNFSSMALGSGSQVRQGGDVSNDLGLLLNSINMSRQEAASKIQNSDSTGPNPQETVSFKDMLLQFAKLSQNERNELIQNAIKPPPPYPEVTVHPVPTSTPPPTNSLLHGILTKSPTKQNTKTSFSPTLARLLTAPEKSATNQTMAASSTPMSNSAVHPSNMSISEILSTSKACNEITITPVDTQYESTPTKGKSMEEEETEDSADRLVIDENNDAEGKKQTNSDNNSDGGDEVPPCQGCNQKPAQFVCAGCGNQWYCSRDCQVSAWDEHSEVCSG